MALVANSIGQCLEMQTIIIFCIGVACYFVYVTCFGGNIIAHGEWRVLNIRRCPNDEQYRIKFDVRRKKVNRTTDGFDMSLYVGETIDETYGVYIDVCVYVDGGCKPYQVLVDDSLDNFLKKHARDNFERIMITFGMDPPDFPIKPGNFGCADFMFDYRQLPETGVIGKYGAFAYMVKDNERICCIEVTIDFIIREGDHFFN